MFVIYEIRKFKIELVGLDYLEKKKIFKKGLKNLSCKKKMKFY